MPQSPDKRHECEGTTPLQECINTAQLLYISMRSLQFGVAVGLNLLRLFLSYFFSCFVCLLEQSLRPHNIRCKGVGVLGRQPRPAN